MKQDCQSKSSFLTPAILAGSALLMLIAYATRFPLADDAYVTFRYAENLRHGHGLVYNPGAWVLGTTSPLWAILLALVSMCGLPLTTFSVLVGIGSTAASVLLCIKHSALATTPSLLRTIGILAAVLFFPLVQMGMTSGMESPLYFLCVLLAFDAYLGGSSARAGVYATICVGLRPDGVLVPLVLTLWSLIEKRRLPVATLFTFCALVVPALALEYIYYGSLFPHSITAKRLIHPGGIIENAEALFSRITRNDLDILAWMLGLSGMYFLLRPRGSQRAWDRLLLTWFICYIAGLLFSGIDPIFYWYFYPILMLVLLLGFSGLSKARVTFEPRIKNIKRWEYIFLGAFVFAVLSYSLSLHLRVEDRFSNVLAYAKVAPALGTAAQPGDTFYLCETGLLGYSLAEYTIFDSSGINSPEILETIKAAQETHPTSWKDWHVDAVRRYSPTWIVAMPSKCSIELMQREPDLKNGYAIWNNAIPNQTDAVILKRVSP